LNLEGAKVLITGGAGFLGSRLARHIITHAEHAQVTVFSRDEKKHYDLKCQLDAIGRSGRMHSVLGDVRDYGRVSEAIARADVVIHAAAMKHITSAEANPTEAVETNVGGAKNVVRALAGGNKPCVFVSTDKAVEPLNVYGMTKAIQERIFQQGCACVGVRYGNVMSSSGSVVPFFRECGKAGRTLPLVSRDMTRFFLTAAQAIELILNTLAHAPLQSIVVPKLKSCRLGDLADVFAAEYNVGINIIGLRQGEKMHELLVSHEELLRVVDSGDCAVIAPTKDAFEGKVATPDEGYLNAFLSSVPVMSRDEVAAWLKREGEL
jgi:UDP-N-acetylglucosamine 4,6-dehydratase